MPVAAITRRTAIALAPAAYALSGLLCAPRAGNAAAHFWDIKPSAEWTPDEIDELAGKSPWAKQVTAQYRAAMDNLRPQSGGGPAGRGSTGAGECGLVPCASVMPGKVVVIWESGQPIREGLHSVIAPEFNGHYVISIRGLEGEQTLDRLKAGSDLSAKGKSPLQPGLASRRNGSYLFGFSRDLLPLDTSDKEVQFTVRTGASLTAILLRAVFNPKEMTYRGVLAL